MKQLLTLLLLSLSHILLSQTLLFKSSFEDGVYLEAPFYDSPDSGTWWQNLQGADESGFSWPISLWDGQGIFQVLVDAELPHADYIENTLEILNDENGNPTRVIHQSIKQKVDENTQDPYMVYTENEEGDLYVRYKIKFTEDLKSLLGPDGWLTFFEWKTSGDYRIAAYIYEDLEDILYWYVHGDNEANGGMPYEEYWYEEDYNIPVPEGDWFTTEFFWHRSTNDDGRFWWAINGNIIADHMGPNKDIEPIDRIMLFTAYSGSNSIDQWVDDIEIWDDFPCGDGISCYDNTTVSLMDLSENQEIDFMAYPNPTHPNTHLSYYLAKQAIVKIDLYNIQGQRVKTLLDKEQKAGNKTIKLDTDSIGEGIYYCKLSIIGQEYQSKSIKIIINQK